MMSRFSFNFMLNRIIVVLSIICGSMLPAPLQAAPAPRVSVPDPSNGLLGACSEVTDPVMDVCIESVSYYVGTVKKSLVYTTDPSDSNEKVWMPASGSTSTTPKLDVVFETYLDDAIGTAYRLTITDINGPNRTTYPFEVVVSGQQVPVFVAGGFEKAVVTADASAEKFTLKALPTKICLDDDLADTIPAHDCTAAWQATWASDADIGVGIDRDGDGTNEQLFSTACLDVLDGDGSNSSRNVMIIEASVPSVLLTASGDDGTSALVFTLDGIDEMNQVVSVMAKIPHALLQEPDCGWELGYPRYSTPTPVQYFFSELVYMFSDGYGGFNEGYQGLDAFSQIQTEYAYVSQRWLSDSNSLTLDNPVDVYFRVAAQDSTLYSCTESPYVPCIESIRYTTDAVITDKSKFTDMRYDYLQCSDAEIKDWCDDSYDNIEHCDPLNMAACKPVRTEGFAYWRPDKRITTSPYVTLEYANQENEYYGNHRFMNLYDEWMPLDDEGNFTGRNNYVYQVIVRGDPVPLYNDVQVMLNPLVSALPNSYQIPRFAISGRPRMECEYGELCSPRWEYAYVTDQSLLDGFDSDYDGVSDTTLLNSACVEALQSSDTTRYPIVITANVPSFFVNHIDGDTPASLAYGTATWMSNRVNAAMQFPHTYFQAPDCGWNLQYTIPSGTTVQSTTLFDGELSYEIFDPDTGESTGVVTQTHGLKASINRTGISFNIGWNVDVPDDFVYNSYTIRAKSNGSKAGQSIPWPNDTQQNAVTWIREGNSMTLPTTTEQGLPIAWSVLTPEYCQITGSSLKALNAESIDENGLCRFSAQHAGNSTFAVFSDTVAIEILSKDAQYVEEYPPEISGTSTVVFPLKTVQGGVLTYVSLTPDICTVTGNKVTGVSEGNCELEVTAPETATGTDFSDVFTPYVWPRTEQMLDYTPDDPMPDGGKQTLASTTDAGLKVTWVSNTPSICSISSVTLTAVDPGTCEFTAMQAGTTAFAPLSQDFSIVIDSKEPQTLTTNFVAMVGLNTQALPQKTDQNTKVTWTTKSPLVCSITGTTVKGVDVSNSVETRECSIRANAAEISTHAVFSDTYTFDVEPRTPQTFPYSTTPITEGLGFSVPASTTETIPLTWASLSTSTCTVKALAITTINAGDCTLRASNLGTNNLLGYSELFTVTVLPLPAQSLPASPIIPAEIKGVATATLPAKTQQNSTLTWSSTTQSICTVSGTTVKAVSPGTCTLKAQAPKVTGQFTAYNADVPITIVEGDPQSLAGSIAAEIVGTGSTDLPAATQQSSALTWSSLTSAVCTVTVSKGVIKVTGVSPGTCQVRGTAAAIGSYKAYQEDTAITIQPKTAQSLSLSFSEIIGTNSATLPVKTSTGGETVNWLTDTTDICSLAGGKVTGKSSGTCKVYGTASSTATYAAFAQLYNITIQPKIAQSLLLSFSEIVGTNTAVLPVKTSTGEVLVYWTSDTPNICSLVGGKVTGKSPGTCKLYGTAASTATYLAFAQFYNIPIQPKTTQLVDFSGTTNVITGTKTVSLPLVTTTGGKTIKWSSTTSWACKLSGNVVTGTSPLTQTNCKVVGSATGDATYADLLPANATLNITVKPKTDQPTPVVNTSNLAKGATRSLPVTSPANIVVTSWKVASSSTSICKVSGYTLTALNVTGTCTIIATNAGNAEYKALNKSYTILVP